MMSRELSLTPPPVFLYEAFDIITSFQLTGHLYADDTPVYISAAVGETLQAAARLAECIERLDQWMEKNRLKSIAEKTRLLWLGTRQQLAGLFVQW